MKNNTISILLLFAFSLLNLNLVIAQEQEHKVVIKNKTVDNNGNEIITEEILTGEEAKTYIKNKEAKKSVIQSNDNISISQTEKTVIENGKEVTKRKIKIVDKSEKGNKQVMEWESDDPNEAIPDEIQKYLSAQDGQNLETQEIEMEVNEKVVAVAPSNKKSNGHLGVAIADYPGGVIVNTVIDNSSAAKAGLQAGDVIITVEKVVIMNTKDLIQTVGSFSAGDEINIKYFRADQEMETTAILKKRVPMTWAEVMKKN